MNRLKQNIKQCLILFTLAAIVWCNFPNLSFAAESNNIVILTADNLTSTRRTIRGAKNQITNKHTNCNFYQFLISNNHDQNLLIIDSIKATKPDLILSVGSAATNLAKENIDNTPIVFAAVKYPALSGFVNTDNNPNHNITGASIDIPVNVQFEKFKKIIPNLKTIGVLYTENTASLITQAKIICSDMGLKLIALKVNDETELPVKLDSLSKMVDGIWSVADENLFKPKLTKYILLNTLKKRIPFMGFSRYVVESGALFALDFDSKAVGIQSGIIVNRILDGAEPSEIKITQADVIWFHYNEKTSKRIAIEIPPEMAAVAKEVYR